MERKENVGPTQGGKFVQNYRPKLGPPKKTLIIQMEPKKENSQTDSPHREQRPWVSCVEEEV